MDFESPGCGETLSRLISYFNPRDRVDGSD